MAKKIEDMEEKLNSLTRRVGNMLNGLGSFWAQGFRISLVGGRSPRNLLNRPGRLMTSFKFFRGPSGELWLWPSRPASKQNQPRRLIPAS